jgi:hypothetical protein
MTLYASPDLNYKYTLPIKYKLKLIGKLFDADDQLSNEVLIKVVGKSYGIEKT